MSPPGVKLLWLLIGMVLGVALARELNRRSTPPPVPSSAEPVAALPPSVPRPAPSGRHAWVPPAGGGSAVDGPDAS